ncbi:MAG: hypothetical protein P1Q69_01295 [Candidatus Thorarchaeota archaeon]|nr:hypothetical protein [Candidatus Thorarchaeota archaeon]
MPQEWKSAMQSMINSLEGMNDIRIRIRTVEQKLLSIAKKSEEDKESDEDNAESVKLLDEVYHLIESVEIKVNQLDMRLSAIERLGSL